MLVLYEAKQSKANYTQRHKYDQHCLTPSPRIYVRVVLVIEIGLVQVSKGLKLHLGILEKAQLHQQCQPHKPKLKHKIQLK